MKVLVTGGAGFIGSHVAERLLADGHEVEALDSFHDFYDPRIKEANLREALKNPRFHLHRGDICDGAALDVLPSVDAIIHLAARAGVRPSIEDPMGYQKANVEGTQNLLEFARTRGIKQFVFASSSSVYGVNPHVPWKEADAVLAPISPYASTKVSGELMGHVYSHLYGIRFVALRFFTVYGPRQRPDLAIHKFTKLLIEGKPIPFFGNGETRRDYTNIADIVEGIVAALNYQGSPYEIVNLGNDRTVSLSELVSLLETATGKKAVLDKKPEQLGDVPQTWADISKAKELLGYAPQVAIEVGIPAYVAWYRGNST